MNMRHVCSLKLAKKLKELGVKQESSFYWVAIKNSKPMLSNTMGGEGLVAHDIVGIYSAFHVGELGEMLPLGYETRRCFDDDWAIWRSGAVYAPTDAMQTRAKTEADARAKMLIYLIENKLMELPK